MRNKQFIIHFKGVYRNLIPFQHSCATNSDAQTKANEIANQSRYSSSSGFTKIVLIFKIRQHKIFAKIC